MRKFGKESTAPTEGVNRESGGWLQNHGALAVCLIAILAFVLRTVFAYGISADGGYALSGGSDAQYHLHVVESILDGSFILGSDSAINYPVGGLNTNAPLYDFIAAGIGSFAGASAALAFLAPVFGVLTCFPVYLIGKELYGTKIGVFAALIFALLALPIVSTVFSNGTEYAFVAFLVCFFIWSLIKVVRKVDSNELGIKEALIAGILFGLVVLSWTDFRAILVMMVIVMVIQMALDRFNSKDFSVTLYTYSIIMVIGLAMGAAYYIPANLWDAVFSGPVLIAVITIAFGFIFKALQKTPWIVTIPGLIIAFCVIAAVLFFVAPDYFTALIFGNSGYSNPIMSDLINSHVSISKMSSYYGWVLMWMPAVLGIWEFIVYARKDRSHQQLFVTMMFIILWMFAWTSYSCAASLGMVFAVSSACVIIRVIQLADFKSYFASMKNAGFPGIFKRILKPLPFVSLLVAVFLIAAPGVAYAVDAGIPSNNDSNYPFYGNTVYTIQTGEGYPISMVYDYFENEGDKDKAVVAWLDYNSALEAKGYNTVNDADGEGASVAAQILLADGSSGATAGQIIRMMTATDKDLSSCFQNHPAVYNAIEAYIHNPDMAKKIVLDDADKYGALSADITGEDAIYIAGIEEITGIMNTAEISETYKAVKDKTGYDIGYYIVDGSMLPIMYGDGSSLSTMAYFAGYNTDSYGAATQFFSYITYYSNYYPATATDALYETFLWKAIIGPSPSDLGYSSSFNCLYELASSNGSVKAMPGYGLAGYDIVNWDVKYNEDPKAASSSDGWKYMPYTEAIEKQQKDGGLINYMSSIITYEYVGAQTSTVSGQIIDENGNGMEGITVSISYFDEDYKADTVFSETKTNADGKFTALVPAGNYSTTYRNGTVKLEPSVTEYEGEKTIVTIESASFYGAVTIGDSPEYFNDYMYVLKSGSIEYFIPTHYGTIASLDAVDAQGNSVSIIPGKYSYELRDSTAATVASGNVTLYAGTNIGLKVSPANYTITVTVNDFFGQPLDGGRVYAVNAETGNYYTEMVEEGKAVIYVPKGTYTLSMGGGYFTNDTTSLSVTSNKTATIKAYEAQEVTITNHPDFPLQVYGGSFSFMADTKTIHIPTSIGATVTSFTVYGFDSENVYMGFYEGGDSITLRSGDICTVTGNIGTAGTVTFIASTGEIVSAVAASDGKFTALLLDDTYTMYANNGSDKAYFDMKYITEDVDLGTMNLVDARKITETYQYASKTSSSNVALPFALAEATFKFEGIDYTIPTVTDASGKAVYYIPDAATSIKVIINDGSIDNEAFNHSELISTYTEGTADSSQTITISDDHINKSIIASEYDIKLTPYSGGDAIEVVAGKEIEIAPGQFTAEINANTGAYFKGTVYIYPGDDYITGLKVIEVYGVKILKGENDKITITGEKSHDNYNDDDVYYFEYDCEYTIKSENTETGKIKYATVNKSESSEEETIDMTTTDDVMKITGFVSVSGDGTVKIKYGDVVLEEKITGGEFSAELPSSAKAAEFNVQITKTISSQKYGYSGYSYVNELSDGDVVNIAVESDNDLVDYSSDLDAYVVDAEFDKGNLTVTLKVFNNTDLTKAYAITAGSAWSLNEAKQVVVMSKDSTTVTVTGTYEPNGVGIGTNGMTVIVSDYNGTSTKTIPLVTGNVIPSESVVTVKTAKDSTNKDKLSGSAYMYALTFTNLGAMNVVDINVTTEKGYTYSLMNEDGSVVVLGGGGSFPVTPQTDTVIYVAIMPEFGKLESVPDVSVETSAGNVSITPSTIDVSVDSVSVSGNGAVSERSSVPLGVWFLIGFSILMLVLIVWMGSKRGVFSRR
jgi:asparagine N-glycosylation enzyme membrane subunit Stt3